MRPSDAARAAIAALALSLAIPAAALGPQPLHEGEHAHGPDGPALTERDFRNAPKDLVLWGELARAGVTRKSGRLHVTFLPSVLALDGKTATLVGFMTSLHPGARHTQFLLSDKPIFCSTCHSAPGPASIVEVNTKSAQKISEKPIMVRGKLELVKDNPNGLAYRLVGANVIRRPQ